MTVRELINQLEKMPKKLEVYVYDNRNAEYDEVTIIKRKKLIVKSYDQKKWIEDAYTDYEKEKGFNGIILYYW